MEWNRLKIFYYVAICQNLTKAALKLNTNQPSLSKSISTLEYQLKTTLFLRTKNGLILTKQGEELLTTVEPIFKTLKSVESSFLEQNNTPQGELRISATRGIINFYLFPFMPLFLREYPKINLRVLAMDTFPDFYLGQCDIAICPPIKDRNDLIQKPLLTNHIMLYASPEYLKKNGTPEKPEDLDNHNLIGIGNELHRFDEMNWHLNIGCSHKKKTRALLYN